MWSIQTFLIVLGSILGGLGLLSPVLRRLGVVMRGQRISFLLWGAILLLAGASIRVVRPGSVAVRVTPWGVAPTPVGPGVHLVKPLLETLFLFDVREHLLSFGGPGKTEPVTGQTQEGLRVGLSVSVRYRLDAARLPYLYANLQHLEDELVPAVVVSAFRGILPNYLVRDVFATKREEVRQKAFEAIQGRLGADGILVREVMLRDVTLPEEYARGLEGLLLKEQENERMVYDLQVKEKQVRQAELEAEAHKARTIKEAEGEAAKKVLGAKAEADAMQHTLPLKEKQVQQSRLEALARKEATLMNAEAAAQTKVIEAKAEVERSRLIADADANRIRVTAAADGERLEREALVLKENPLLIQKIVAEKLSDKMQIMMVPTDGQNFFANEIFKAAALPRVPTPPAQAAPSPSPTKMARHKN